MHFSIYDELLNLATLTDSSVTGKKVDVGNMRNVARALTPARQDSFVSSGNEPKNGKTAEKLVGAGKIIAVSVK